jgi:hypothetical protein
MPSAPSATVWGRKGQRTVNFTHDLRCEGNSLVTKSVGYNMNSECTVCTNLLSSYPSYLGAILAEAVNALGS